MPSSLLALTLNFVLIVAGKDSRDARTAGVGMAGWDWENSCLDSGSGGCSRLLLKMVSGRELCVDGLICEAREGRDKRRVYSFSDNVDINVLARSNKQVNL